MNNESVLQDALRASFKRFADYGQTKYRKSDQIGSIIGLNRFQFGKLCKDSGLCSSRTFRSADVDLLFSKLKTTNDDLSLDFNHFLEALERISKKQGIPIEEIYRRVIAGKPSLRGTHRPDRVRLHDDKANTYTGVSAQSVDPILSCPVLLHPMLQRRYRTMLCKGMERIKESASTVSSMGPRAFTRSVSDIGSNALRHDAVASYAEVPFDTNHVESSEARLLPSSQLQRPQVPARLEIPGTPGPSSVPSPAAWSEQQQMAGAHRSVSSAESHASPGSQLLSPLSSFRESSVRSHQQSPASQARRYRRSSSDAQADPRNNRGLRRNFEPERLMVAIAEDTEGSSRKKADQSNSDDEDWPGLGKAYSQYHEAQMEKAYPKSPTHFSELQSVSSTISNISGLSVGNAGSFPASAAEISRSGAWGSRPSSGRPQFSYRSRRLSSSEVESRAPSFAAAGTVAPSLRSRRSSHGSPRMVTTTIRPGSAAAHHEYEEEEEEEEGPGMILSAMIADMTNEDVANDILQVGATFQRFQTMLEKRSSGLHTSPGHSWGRFQVYCLDHLFRSRSKKGRAKPSEAKEQIHFVKNAMIDFFNEELAMQRVFNSFCLHGTWQPKRHASYIDREPRMTVTAFTDMCEYCVIPNVPKVSQVGAQGMFNVVKTRGTSRIVFWQLMDVLAGISQAMDVPLEELRKVVAAPYLTRNDRPAREVKHVEPQEETVEEEPVMPTRTIIRTADIYAGLFAPRISLHAFSS